MAMMKFLASLNDKIEQPFQVTLEAQYISAAAPAGAAGAPAAPSTWPVPTGYEFFAYEMTGFMEVIPSAMAANFVEDSDMNLLDMVTVQVTSSISNQTLFSVACTMAACVSGYKRGSGPLKFRVPWRFPSSSLVTATFACRAPTTAPGWTVQHRFGIMLNGVLVDQATMLKYGRQPDRADYE
jgi:hypothetical protein